MEKYYINPIDLYDVLKSKGITNFFHANTIKTAKSFIKHNALLSRGYFETNKLEMSPQKSDNHDKQFGVWNDIFLDGKDLSDFYNRPNFYGPITFVMSLELLKSNDMGDILVTRNNPMYWSNNNTNAQKYLLDINEVDSLYLNGCRSAFGRIMFTFRGADNKMKLSEFCEEIIIDKLGMKYKGEDFDSYLYNGLCSKINDTKLSHIPITQRNKFINNYKYINHDILTSRFIP